MSFLRSQHAVTFATYLLAGALACLWVGWYNGYEGWLEVSSRRMQLFLAAGAAGSLAALAVIGYAFAANQRARKEQFWLPLISAAVILIVAALAVEVALRVLAQPTTVGERIGNTQLIPYDWELVAERNLELWENSRRETAFYVGDPELGWSIGRSRSSDDGLYFSSRAGLRAATAGESYDDVPIERRIALFGDSFAFSEEVGFESSLAYQLEGSLGEGYRILNFGVPGYGVDQAYLRFSREHAQWQAPVTIFAFVQDDLNRAANVYTFLKPSWGIPFSKPRFFESGDELGLLNVPNVTPDDMFGESGIFQLPNLGYDVAFFDHEWKSNLLLRVSYLSRFLVSRFPRWPEQNAHTSDDAIASLGARLLARFHDEALAAGTRPLIVYFPSLGDYGGQDRSLKDSVIEALRERGIDVLNPSECLRKQVAADQTFVTGGVHYSRAGNEAMARCMLPAVRALVAS